MLMMVSMLLLTGFLMYWLRGQYKQEKAELREELVEDLIQSRNQAIDSILVVSVIRPALVDTTMVKSDTLPHQEMLTRGVKMVMEMTLDSLNDDSSGIREFIFSPDTQMVGRFFTKRIRTSGVKDITARWHTTNDSLVLTEKRSEGMIIRSLSAEPGLAVEISKYRSHLLWQIFPQCLFGMILVLMTGGAFLITWRSLVRQYELNLMRNEFVSNISHELKTPVSTVKVALEAIERYGGHEAAGARDQYIKMASVEIDRLDHLINKVMNQMLLEGGALGMISESIDLRRLVEEVSDLFRSRTDISGHQLKMDLPPETVTIAGDAFLLHGVMMNLLDNALKYGKSLIHISFVVNVDQVRVLVCDDGPGIPSRYHTRIFEKFFRVPAGDRHDIKGHGLGLSFVAMVMKMHQGNVSVENRSEGGCCFTLSFHLSDDQA